MKKVLIIIGILVVIGAVVALNVLKKEKGLPVTTEKISFGDVQAKVTGSGQIKPAVEVKISAQVAGKIVQLKAKEGDRVKKGDLLVALDPTQYMAQLERAESSLISARANEKKAKSDLERSTGLFNSNMISNAEIEGAQASYEAASSNSLQSEASLKEAQDALAKTRLYATMDGYVTRMNKELGEMVIGATFQEDVIMIVSDLSVMEAVIEVDENDVIQIEKTDSAQISLDAFPDTIFTGMVTEIANSAIVQGLGTQEQVTNFEVTITFDRPDAKFRPGMSTTVDILTERKEKVLRVPIQAVTVREENRLKPNDKPEQEDPNAEKKMVEVVFVMENGVAVAKPVKIGISDDSHYAIESGLQENDEVITGPFKALSLSLKDGDLVTKKQEKEKGPKNAD